MKSIVKGIDQINRLVTWVVVILLSIMCIVVFAQVIFRYVLHAALPWSEELSRYLMIWSTFLGAALGVRRKALLGMEVLVKALPKIGQRIAVELVALIQVVFLCVIFYFGIKMTIIANNQTSPAMLIPMSWAYTGIPVGAALMILNTLAVAMEERWGGAK